MPPPMRRSISGQLSRWQAASSRGSQGGRQQHGCVPVGGLRLALCRVCRMPPPTHRPLAWPSPPTCGSLVCSVRGRARPHRLAHPRLRRGAARERVPRRRRHRLHLLPSSGERGWWAGSAALGLLDSCWSVVCASMAAVGSDRRVPALARPRLNPSCIAPPLRPPAAGGGAGVAHHHQGLHGGQNGAEYPIHAIRFWRRSKTACGLWMHVLAAAQARARHLAHTHHTHTHAHPALPLLPSHTTGGGHGGAVRGAPGSGRRRRLHRWPGRPAARKRHRPRHGPALRLQVGAASAPLLGGLTVGAAGCRGRRRGALPRAAVCAPPEPPRRLIALPARPPLPAPRPAASGWAR